MLRGQAVEYFVEVVAVEPVSLTRNLVQCGVRYLVGLIDAALNDDVAIEIAVPYMHGDCDLAEAKPPWSQFKPDVLHGGAASRRRRSREVISQCGTLFAMRMSNERDQALLRSAVPETTANLRTRTLAQSGSDHCAHQPGSHRGNALRNAVRPQHLVLRDVGFGRRGTADDGAADKAIAEEPRASCGVRSTARMTDHSEAIDAKVVG